MHEKNFVNYSLTLTDGFVVRCSFWARGSMKILNNGGDKIDPCGTPTQQIVEELVTFTAVVRLVGRSELWIIATVLSFSRF